MEIYRKFGYVSKIEASKESSVGLGDAELRMRLMRGVQW